MAPRSARPDLPNLPPPRFGGADNAQNEDALKQRLRNAGAEVGFGNRAGASPVVPSPEPPPRAATPMKTLQLVIPDYLFEQLHMNAATERVTKKYLVLQALAHAGYRIEASDLDEDGRRNR
jgi:hypothetical protein